MDLTGKVAVVTGGADGLNRTFIELLLKHGSKVAFLGEKESEGKELKETLAEGFGSDRVEFFHVDPLAKNDIKEAFQKVVDRFGSIDIVYNYTVEVHEKDWENTIRVNLDGLVIGTYMGLKFMSENTDKKGTIVNVVTIAGLKAIAVAPVYSATQYGAVGFTRGISSSVVKFGLGVRINLLCRGLIKADLKILDNKERFEKFHQLMTPIDQLKFVEPEDVAEASLLLLTDESKNGELLKVTSDGVEFVPFPDNS